MCTPKFDLKIKYFQSTRGLVAMTSAPHAEGRQFDPGRATGVIASMMNDYCVYIYIYCVYVYIKVSLTKGKKVCVLWDQSQS